MPDRYRARQTRGLRRLLLVVWLTAVVPAGMRGDQAFFMGPTQGQWTQLSMTYHGVDHVNPRPPPIILTWDDNDLHPGIEPPLLGCVQRLPDQSWLADAGTLYYDNPDAFGDNTWSVTSAGQYHYRGHFIKHGTSPSEIWD